MAKDALGEIYSDSQQLGIFVVSVSVLITIIVAVIMILYSLLLIVPHDPHDLTTKGEVVISDCSKLKNGLTRCQLSVNYVVNNKPYLVSDEIDVKDPLKVGDSVDVHVDSARPEDALIGRTARQTGLMLMGSGLMLLVVAIVSLWLVNRFKVLAAASGVSAVVGLF